MHMHLCVYRREMNLHCFFCLSLKKINRAFCRFHAYCIYIVVGMKNCMFHSLPVLENCKTYLIPLFSIIFFSLFFSLFLPWLPEGSHISSFIFLIYIYLYLYFSYYFFLLSNSVPTSFSRSLNTPSKFKSLAPNYIRVLIY